MTRDCADSDAVAWLAAWDRGDRRAGSAFIERYFAVVYRFLRRRLSDGATAKDLAQRTFLACLESAHRFTPSTAVQAYVLGIARNLLLHHLRDARPMPPSEREPSLTPSGAVGRAEQCTHVRTALAALPDTLRVVVELHYWDELSVAQISELLTVPIGTVKWRLYRGRALLAARLSKESS